MGPSHLFRAFDSERYAREFVDCGRFRLGSLEYYKTIEDCGRRDEKEGTSSFITPEGLIVGGMVGNNPVYLLCTSGPDVDLEYLRGKKKKRELVVRINDPYQLLADIRNAVPVERVKLWGKCELEVVSYTRDGVLKIDPDSPEALYLDHRQKSQVYCNEFEYRYVVFTYPPLEGKPSSFLNYELGRPLAYLEVLERGLT